MNLELNIPLFAMLVSLTAMFIQLVFGVMGMRRAKAETDRQIAETKKQEVLYALQIEESYKEDVREWGLSVLDAMARAQQLCTIDPKTLKNSDFSIEQANTVASMRGLLNRANWLFPNLAIPSRDDKAFSFVPERKHSALEALLYAYHTLDKVKEGDPDHRKTSQGRIRRFRKEFMAEMRRAVDPQVRGADIEKLVAEIHRDQEKETDGADLPEGSDDKSGPNT